MPVTSANVAEFVRRAAAAHFSAAAPAAGEVRGRRSREGERSARKQQKEGNGRQQGVRKKRAERYFFYKGNFLFVERMMMKMEKDRR